MCECETNPCINESQEAASIQEDSPALKSEDNLLPAEQPGTPDADAALNLKTDKHEQEEQRYRFRRKLVSIISLVILIVFFIAVTIFVGKPLIERLQEPEEFRQWVDNHYIWGRIAFIGMVVLQVVVAIIPGEPMEIGAGYAFGTWEGMLLCLIGVAVGSAVIYGFTRLFGIKMVEAFISREKLQSLNFIKNSRKLNLIIFIAFLIPGTPKDVLTYFIGLTPMKLRVFLGITLFARIPSVISSTLGGDALGMQNYTLAIVVFVLTGLLSLVAILLYRRFPGVQSEKESVSPQEEDIPQNS